MRPHDDGEWTDESTVVGSDGEFSPRLPEPSEADDHPDAPIDEDMMDEDDLDGVGPI